MANKNQNSPKKYNSKVKIKIEPPFICKICNKELKSISGLASHLNNQHTKSYCDYLKDFYNIDIEEINKNWEEGRESRKKEGHVKTKTNNKKIHLSPKDRLTKEQYDNWRNSMLGVFTRGWFIQKYGKEKGIELYENRVKNISEKNYLKPNISTKSNWSKMSQEFFWDIYDIIKDDYKKVYFGELNHEYSCGTKKNFDFVILDNKKVIEFNGDKFHANPEIYEKNDIPLKFIGKSAKELWKEDKEKHKTLIENGYSVLVIWEKDYLKNKDKEILKCLKFIKT